MNLPPTVGDIIKELRDTREVLQAIKVGIQSGDAVKIVACGMLAMVTEAILAGLLERIDAKPDANQPRNVAKREGFA